ncbi:TetR/AcrR family transcriptional regulator [Paenibacillus filicis]|uniref:TetR/AcrR family transcriptional regulator n=1 Tax=Paenibacillus gyeongsangnamensis TaxID=3388067 RepID=A0ABT4QIL9_9BACL|nr:TetR/AcrR family transcriptional regulator [Paenibacillus filicis]MCZ8516695.1 TetR/AcrR family transcriptional regulator [Paenibacillus filicis]
MNLRPSAGRPRSEESKNAILNATIELLNKSGYPALTIEGIASHAGVSKATIYRWWNHKTLLVMDAFIMLIAPPVELRDEETLRENFLMQLTALSNVFNSTIGRTMLSIISESAPDSEVFKAFYSQYILPRRAAARRILQASILRGEIRSDIDIDVVLDMIYGPIYFRFLIHKRPLETSFLETLIDYTLQAIRR